MSNSSRNGWNEQQSVLSARMRGFLENPGKDQLDAVVAEMRAYAEAARTGSIEIPQVWVSYD